MKFISLFAGIGGFDLGFERAGMKCVAQVEIDDFCGKVLKKHWPNVPLFKDVRDVGKHNLPAAELICGGFPCQDVSLAGKRLGLKGKRSTLWSEFYRIVCEIQPRWVVIENVTGLFSSDNGVFFRRILWQLHQVGYNAEWHVIPASRFGAPHKRERIFIVAHPRNDGCGRSKVIKRQLPNNKIRNMEKVLEERLQFQSRTFEGSEYDGEENMENRESWELEPPLCRVDDGISDRSHKIRVLGNAVVPQVAEFIGRAIMEVT